MKASKIPSNRGKAAPASTAFKGCLAAVLLVLVGMSWDGAICPAKPNETVGERIDDASITAQVKMSLLSRRSTSAAKTKVETTDGVITLTGIAKSTDEKALVTRLATDVNGVNSVVNNMTIGTNLSKS